MKTIIYLLGFTILFATNFNQQKQIEKPKLSAEIKQSTDSVEYDLIIFDIGFESYLATIPYTKNFYTNNYLKNWNLRYVTEWNVRAINPLQYGSFYENQIDYQSNIDYGLDLNFKLYQYFQFIEKKHKVILVQRK